MEELQGCVATEWSCEVETLNEVASVRAEGVELGFSLDAFGDGREAERMSQVDDGLREGSFRSGEHVVHEGAVDLEEVDREPLESRGGVAGLAELTARGLAQQRLELAQFEKRPSHRRISGHDEPIPESFAVCGAVGDRAHRGGANELHIRQVDAYRKVGNSAQRACELVGGRDVDLAAHSDRRMGIPPFDPYRKVRHSSASSESPTSRAAARGRHAGNLASGPSAVNGCFTAPGGLLFAAGASTGTRIGSARLEHRRVGAVANFGDTGQESGRRVRVSHLVTATGSQPGRSAPSSGAVRGREPTSP